VLFWHGLPLCLPSAQASRSAGEKTSATSATSATPRIVALRAGIVVRRADVALSQQHVDSHISDILVSDIRAHHNGDSSIPGGVGDDARRR
jgi:hypothetical protein